MIRLIVQTVFFFGLLSTSFAARLGVSGTTLTYDGKQVYLNGVNIAWNNFGNDFGNGNYDGSIEEWMQDIGSAGGNTARIWVHEEGYSTPVFDINGMVTACDNTGDFLSDVVTFLDAAQESGILVIFTIWNGAFMSNEPMVNMILDDDILQSYLDNCLTDWAKTVAGHPALGAWEIMNEPEGSVLVASDSNPCYDTTLIGQQGAGWSLANIPMERILVLTGKMAQTIRANDPTGLVTLGSWSQFSSTDAFSDTRNHYTDACLNGAAGNGSELDFHQIHSYDWDGSWTGHGPFTLQASDYELNKPILLGEFSSVCGAGNALSDLNTYAYENGYVGGLSWHWKATGQCTDTREVQGEALGTLASREDNGVVNITVG